MKNGDHSMLVGIDLNGYSRDVYAARCNGEIELKRIKSDEELLGFCDGASVVAIDAPLGYPIAFANAVQKAPVLSTFTQWESGTVAKAYVYRETDIHATTVLEQYGHRSTLPLSVSTDRIGIVALRAIYLSQKLREKGFVVVPQEEREPGKPAVIEVYPRLVLASMIPAAQIRPSYKKKTDGCREVVKEYYTCLMPELEKLFGVPVPPIKTDDELDALACLWMAKKFEQGEAAAPLDSPAIRTEGWIYYVEKAASAIAS